MARQGKRARLFQEMPTTPINSHASEGARMEERRHMAYGLPKSAYFFFPCTSTRLITSNSQVQRALSMDWMEGREGLRRPCIYSISLERHLAMCQAACMQRKRSEREEKWRFFL